MFDYSVWLLFGQLPHEKPGYAKGGVLTPEEQMKTPLVSREEEHTLTCQEHVKSLTHLSGCRQVLSALVPCLRAPRQCPGYAPVSLLFPAHFPVVAFATGS